MQVLQSLSIQTLSKLCLCTSSMTHLKAWAWARTMELVSTLAIKANYKSPLQSLAIKALTPFDTIFSSGMIHIIVTHYSPMINELSLDGSFQFFNCGHLLLMNCFISQVLDEIQDWSTLKLKWIDRNINNDWKRVKRE